MLQDLQRLLPSVMNTCVVLRSTGSQKLWKLLVGVWQKWYDRWGISAFCKGVE